LFSWPEFTDPVSSLELLFGYQAQYSCAQSLRETVRNCKAFITDPNQVDKITKSLGLASQRAPPTCGELVELSCATLYPLLLEFHRFVRVCTRSASAAFVPSELAPAGLTASPVYHRYQSTSLLVRSALELRLFKYAASTALKHRSTKPLIP
jgi:hypothetical protein